MSPRQCTFNLEDGPRSGTNASSVARETAVAAATNGGGGGPVEWVGPFELMRFALEHLAEYVDWVDELETAEDANAAHRHRVFDSLVSMAHVAHRYLRHDNPDVREAAELLTTSTANLIGRMYAAFGTAAGVFR